jgi:hypothetical protein
MPKDSSSAQKELTTKWLHHNMQTRLNRRASRSAEGIRFLFLASGLISASDNFDAVRSLASIVHRAAEDKTLGSIVHQMKDLLDLLVISPNEACSHSVVPTGRTTPA